MFIEIGMFKKDLSDIIKGFFYSYRTFSLTKGDHASFATRAEIGYFKRLGEMLNFETEIEARMSSSDRPADLVWFECENEYEYYDPKHLVLHLERETRGWEKVKPTVEKLFRRAVKTTVPMGIAIIDNIPDSKITDTIEYFSKIFYSRKSSKNLPCYYIKILKKTRKNK
ncbi:hypothetical protein ACFL4N_04160 [Thermodesulfobacteriota bacterium]